MVRYAWRRVDMAGMRVKFSTNNLGKQKWQHQWQQRIQ
nr:E405 [uncultured bacterium]